MYTFRDNCVRQNLRAVSDAMQGNKIGRYCREEIQECQFLPMLGEMIDDASLEIQVILGQQTVQLNGIFKQQTA